MLVWSDGHYGPDGTMQDVVTFRDTVSDPMYAYLHLKVSYGSVKIVKTSEDGEVSGISFTVSATHGADCDDQRRRRNAAR